MKYTDLHPVWRFIIASSLFMLIGMFFITRPASAAVNPKQLACMAENIYHEARGEPIEGQVLVARTVLERVQSPKWPNTPCKVIYQSSQFSWTSDENRTPLSDEPLSYKLAESIAEILMVNPRESETNPDHYLRCDYRDRVDWWKEMTFLYQIGNHCFYDDETR